MEHPQELSRVAGLQKKVDEVKNVMVDNIEQVRQAILHVSRHPASQPCRPSSCHERHWTASGTCVHESWH